MRDHRLPVELDQSLVDAAHAPAHAAGQHDAGDLGVTTEAARSVAAAAASSRALVERVAGRRAVDRLVERGEHDMRFAGHSADSKKSLVPQRRQKPRYVCGDDSCAAIARRLA